MSGIDFSLKNALAQKSTQRSWNTGRALEESALELAVIMPAYNEEGNVASAIAEWIGALRAIDIRFVFLVIDDGSKDRTREVIQEQETLYSELVGWSKENNGHGISCRKGYEQALAADIAWVFQIDSDGQCDPVYFNELWKARADADVLYGVRVSRDDGLARTLTSVACRIGTFLWTGAYLRDPNVPYRLIRADALRCAMMRIPLSFNLYNVALSLALKKEKTLRWKYFPIHFRRRPYGEGSLNILGVIRVGFRMLFELKSVR